MPPISARHLLNRFFSSCDSFFVATVFPGSRNCGPLDVVFAAASMPSAPRSRPIDGGFAKRKKKRGAALSFRWKEPKSATTNSCKWSDSRPRSAGDHGNDWRTTRRHEVVRRPAQSSEFGAGLGGGRANGKSAGVQDHRFRKVSLRYRQTGKGAEIIAGSQAEGNQVSGKHRRTRLHDKDPPRRRISRSRK